VGGLVSFLGEIHPGSLLWPLTAGASCPRPGMPAIFSDQWGRAVVDEYILVRRRVEDVGDVDLEDRRLGQLFRKGTMNSS